MIGGLGTTTGADGNPHNTDLANATTYYYRVMCGGAIETGSFLTTAGSRSTTTISVAYKSTQGTQARVRYGNVAGTLTTGSWISCAAGCTLSMPGVTTNSQLVYWIDEGTASVAVFTASVPTVLPI
jgi:hypothetical protein